MPLYDYACDGCGPFRDWHPMSEAAADAECPACGRPSKRTVSMPFLRCVSRNVRIAHERNERSADEPKVMRREELLAAHGQIRPHGNRPPGHHHGRNMYRSSVLGHAH
jgi:putative FmdB family regulatory protein